MLDMQAVMTAMSWEYHTAQIHVLMGPAGSTLAGTQQPCFCMLGRVDMEYKSSQVDAGQCLTCGRVYVAFHLREMQFG